MKTCPNCQAQLDEAAMFCTNCGTRFNAQGQNTQNQNQNQFNGQYGAQQQQFAQAPAYDAYDHTAEFSPKDISDNKVMSMIVYLMGWIGIIIAPIRRSTSVRL